MKAELVYNLPEAEYHADETTLSASGAKVLLGKRAPAESEALSFGTLVHVAILEPDRLTEYVPLDPNAIGVKADGTTAQNPTSTAAWKNAVAEVAAEDKHVVSQSDLDRAKAMAQAVFAHPMARKVLDLATGSEVSAYADHASGVRVRARFDVCGPIIGDIKTCRDANPKWFGKTSHDFGYHLSAANYLDIAAANDLEPTDFALINVEKEPTPGGEHRVSVINFAPTAIDLGRREMTEACHRWLALGKRIDLPSYGDGFHTIDLPSYAYSATTYTDDPIWSAAS